MEKSFIVFMTLMVSLAFLRNIHLFKNKTPRVIEVKPIMLWFGAGMILWGAGALIF